MPKTAKAKDNMNPNLITALTSAGMNEDQIKAALDQHGSAEMDTIVGNRDVTEGMRAFFMEAAKYTSSTSFHVIVDWVADKVENALRRNGKPGMARIMSPVMVVVAQWLPTALQRIADSSGNIDPGQMAIKVSEMITRIRDRWHRVAIGDSIPELSEEDLTSLAVYGVIRGVWAKDTTMREDPNHRELALKVKQLLKTQPEVRVHIPIFSQQELTAAMDHAETMFEAEEARRAGTLQSNATLMASQESARVELRNAYRRFATLIELSKFVDNSDLAFVDLWETRALDLGDMAITNDHRDRVREWLNRVAENGPEALAKVRQTAETIARVAGGSLLTGIVLDIVVLWWMGVFMFGNWSMTLASPITSVYAMLLLLLIGPVAYLWLGTWISGKKHWTWVARIASGLMWLMFATGWFALVAFQHGSYFGIQTYPIDGDISQGMHGVWYAINVLIWVGLVGSVLLGIIARFLKMIIHEIVNGAKMIWQGVSPAIEGSISRSVIQMFQKDVRLPPTAPKADKEKDTRIQKMTGLGTSLTMAQFAIITANMIFSISVWLVGPSWILVAADLMALLVIWFFAEVSKKLYHLIKQEMREKQASYTLMGASVAIFIIFVSMILCSGIAAGVGLKNADRMHEIWNREVGQAVDWIDRKSSPRGTEDDRMEEIRKRHK